MISDLKKYEAWFVTGSQHLYGPETLLRVEEDARTIALALNGHPLVPVRIVHKPTLTDPAGIARLCREASQADTCVGLIAWMHTFSPARMWIGGLKALRKPLLHLHTQFNRDIPWQDIDMDFMNLNQSAHGGREFGFINSRMRINRKVVVGHWQDAEVVERLAVWTRAACARQGLQGAAIARFGDNMRQVAVTEGDKVAAEIAFGFSVNGYGLGDLAAVIREGTDAEIDGLCGEYGDLYALAPDLQPGGRRRDELREAARIEIGLRRFLERGNFAGFTDTFEDLHGLRQLPGIAVQRLMQEGYGFGAEGDWKTAALLRAVKVMGAGLPGGSSFMEDYTYHFMPGNQQVLGAHMLEICPSIASGRPSCEIHPLSIGGKSDPVRLVFDGSPGPAVNASLIDLGDRFRLLVNVVDAVPADAPLPRLPVARVLWKPQPDLRTAAASWIYAGGAHHTCFSRALVAEHLEDFAIMFDVELCLIDAGSSVRSVRDNLRWNDLYYRLNPAQ
jgi:L-arabinose isomerase